MLRGGTVKVIQKIKNAKSYMQHNQKKFILIMCLVVVVGGVLAGTLAWLSSRSGTVVNNFIGSNLEIDLAESTTEYVMQPHLTIPKDPTVTVKANSEACWLFLQVKESDAQANGSGLDVVQGGVTTKRYDDENGTYRDLSFSVVEGTNEFNGWNLMTNEEVATAGFPKVSDDGSVNTYYYRKVGADGTAIDQAETFQILVDDQVVVNDYIINDELSQTQLEANPVKITFTPVAVQRLGFDFANAGQEVSQMFE